MNIATPANLFRGDRDDMGDTNCFLDNKSCGVFFVSTKKSNRFMRVMYFWSRSWDLCVAAETVERWCESVHQIQSLTTTHS